MINHNYHNFTYKFPAPQYLGAKHGLLSYLSVTELTDLISPYKHVQIETKVYANSRGGKGNVAGSHEILFVCHPK